MSNKTWQILRKYIFFLTLVLAKYLFFELIYVYSNLENKNYKNKKQNFFLIK